MTMTPEDVQNFIAIRNELREEIRIARETLSDLRAQEKRARQTVDDLLDSHLTSLVNARMNELQEHIGRTIKETDQFATDHIFKAMQAWIKTMGDDPVVQLSISALAITMANPLVRGAAEHYIDALAKRLGVDELRSAAMALQSASPSGATIRTVPKEKVPDTFRRTTPGKGRRP